MQWKRSFVILGVTILAVVASIGLYRRFKTNDGAVGSGISSSGTPSITETLQSVQLAQRDGKPFGLQRLQGSYVLVHFWASWCAPCEEELPALVSFAEQVPGVLVLAVSLDRGWIDADKMLEPLKRPKNWIDVLDANLRLPEAFGTYQYPETYLYDAEGQLAAKWVGPQAWSAPGFIRIFTERVSKK